VNLPRLEHINRRHAVPVETRDPDDQGLESFLEVRIGEIHGGEERFARCNRLLTRLDERLGMTVEEICRRSRSAQHHLDGGNEDSRLDRLLEERHRAELEGGSLELIEAGIDDDRRHGRRDFPGQALQELQPGNLWHLHVQDDDGRTELLSEQETYVAIGRRGDSVARLDEDEVVNVHERRAVIDDKDQRAALCRLSFLVFFLDHESFLLLTRLTPKHTAGRGARTVERRET